MSDSASTGRKHAIWRKVNIYPAVPTLWIERVGRSGIYTVSVMHSCQKNDFHTFRCFNYRLPFGKNKLPVSLDQCGNTAHFIFIMLVISFKAWGFLQIMWHCQHIGVVSHVSLKMAFRMQVVALPRGQMVDTCRHIHLCNVFGQTEWDTAVLCGKMSWSCINTSHPETTWLPLSWTKRWMFTNHSRHGESVYDEILAQEGNWMRFKLLCIANKKHINHYWTSKMTDLRLSLSLVMLTVIQICYTRDSVYIHRWCQKHID